MKNKTTHEIECINCNKPAVWNLCNVWQKYPIDNNGDYGDIADEWEGDSSIDLCDECYIRGDY